MTRLGAIALSVLAIAAAVLVIGGPGAEAESDYRIDAIFDTGKGILPDQLVKIAGAEVGTISDVALTEDFKARVQMQIDSRFAPFRSDARCQIQPEGLISENFVQCEPGTPDGRPLEGDGDQAPTVPVKNTSVPVSLTDLFNIWKVPVRDRFSVVLAGLGAGVAGRGSDLNEVLRRASPTLKLVNDVTEIAGRQRDQIATLVTTTDRVIDGLARRSGDVAAFVDRAEQVTGRTARKQAELRETVRRLPALLSATRPALARLDELAAEGRPLLAQLRGAAPQVQRLVGGLRPFARTARSAFSELGSTAVQGRTTIRSAKPVVRLLEEFSHKAIPAGLAVDQLFGSLRQRGFVENLLGVVYGVGATTSRYDRTAHLAPARLTFGDCGLFATSTKASCSARFSGPVGSSPRSRERRRQDEPERRSAPAPRAPERGPQQQAPAPTQPKRRPLLPDLPKLPKLDPPKLLDDIGSAVGGLLDRPPSRGDSNRGQRGLLDFLLK